MKFPMPIRRFLPALTLPLVMALTHCGKRDEAAAPGGAKAQVLEALGVTTSSGALATQAPKMGFAAKLPLETEIYLGTAQLKKHLDGIKKSAWWKEISALMGDRTPAPSGGNSVEELFTQIWGDDMFIAGGAGFTESAALFRDLNRAYNEIYFKILMTGGASYLQMQGGGSPGAFGPMSYIQPLLADQPSLDRLGDLVARFQLPPLLIGVKTDKGRQLITEMFSEKSMRGKPEQIEVSDLKTPEGHDFKVLKIEMSKVISTEMAEGIVKNPPPDVPGSAVKTLEKAISDVRQKTFYFAIGTVDDYLVVATGKNLDHLKFTSDPSKSLLAKPDLAWLQPYAEKDVTGLIYASGAVQTALHDDQPLVPMLRGVVSALKGSETFRPMAQALEGKVAELSPLESAVYAADFTNLAAISWWGEGAFQMEAFGGAKSRFMATGKPLTFAPVVDKPGVVFGLAYHRNPEFEKAVRLWMEKFFSIIYAGAQELVKAGIAGEEGAKGFAAFNLLALPHLTKVYEADRDITEKGLGSQVAFLVDVNGKVPSLPGVNLEASKNVNFPRIAFVTDVANRGEVAKGWESINQTVTALVAFAQAQSPDYPALPPLSSSEANGMTTWFYETEFFNGDLYPVSSISDKLLVVSTSKPGADAIAAEVSKTSSTSADGLVWRLDVSALADFVSSAVSLVPGSESDAAEVKQNMKWLKPFQAMQGRIYEEKGQSRLSFKWKLGDIVSFD